MANRKKMAIRNSFLILICIGLSSCAGFEKFVESIGGFFQGNTEVDKRDYDLEAKREYRKYRYIRTRQIKDDEEKILTNLSEDDQKKTKIQSHNDPEINKGLSTERQIILKYKKVKNTKPVLQKLLEPYQPTKIKK